MLRAEDDATEAFLKLMDDMKEENEQEDLSELISLLKLHNLASHPNKIEVLDDEKSG